MSNERTLRDLILEWVDRDQKHKVLSELVLRQVGASTADQLVRGKYPQEPQGANRERIEDALRAAGFLPEPQGKTSKVS